MAEGSIEGKTYPSEMASMKENSDEWIASVLSYIRYEFVGTNIRVPKGRQSAVVQPEEVKALRAKYTEVNEAWTMEAFENLLPKSTKN